MTDTDTQSSQQATGSNPTTNSADPGDKGKGGGGDKAKAAGGGGEEDKSWLESLPEDLRGDKKLAGYESAEAQVRAHLNLEKRFGIPPERRIDLPEDMTNADEMAKVYGKLGRPEKPEDYQLTFPKDAPDEVKALGAVMAQTAFEAGLNGAQLQKFVDLFNAQTAANSEAMAKAAEAETAATDKALKAEFGDKLDTYKSEIGNMLGELVGDDGVKALNQKGWGNDLTLIKLLAKICDLRAEPGKAAGEGAAPAGGERKLTPAKARGAIAEMNADPVKVAALHDANHPLHKSLIKEREDLMKAAYPTDQAA